MDLAAVAAGVVTITVAYGLFLFFYSAVAVMVHQIMTAVVDVVATN